MNEEADVSRFLLPYRSSHQETARQQENQDQTMDIPEQLDETYQEPVQNEGSTSSSDHSSPVLPEPPEEPCLGPHISLKDVRGHDDHWTYPQTNASKGTQPGYAPELRVPVDGVTGYLTRGSNSNPNPNLTPRREKRPRQLQSPDLTADVRKSGACLPCRLSKTRVRRMNISVISLPVTVKAETILVQRE